MQIFRNMFSMKTNYWNFTLKEPAAEFYPAEKSRQELAALKVQYAY
jgi:hypothetical protein